MRNPLITLYLKFLEWESNHHLLTDRFLGIKLKRPNFDLYDFSL